MNDAKDRSNFYCKIINLKLTILTLYFIFICLLNSVGTYTNYGQTKNVNIV